MSPEIVTPLHRLFIWGLEGSRKTSIAYELYRRFFEPRGYGFLALQAPSFEDFGLALVRASREFSKVFLLLDDLTYTFHHAEKSFRAFAHHLTLIRHNLGLDKHVAVCIVAHYAASVPPVLRVAHTYVLTSLTTPAELSLARAYFKGSYLTLFRRLYLRYPNRVALINWLGRHGILKTSGVYHEVPYFNAGRMARVAKLRSIEKGGYLELLGF